MTEPASDEEFLTPLQRIYLEKSQATLRSDADVQRRTQREVRGFLGLIIFSMLALTPLVAVIWIGLLYADTPGAAAIPPVTRTVTTAFLAVFAVSSAFVGWRLAYRRVRSSVTIAIGFIAVTGVAPILIALALGTDMTAAGWSLFWSSVWILYLLLSRRVKAVYSPDHQATGEIFE